MLIKKDKIIDLLKPRPNKTEIPITIPDLDTPGNAATVSYTHLTLPTKA